MNTKSFAFFPWLVVLITGVTTGMLTIYFIPAQWEILIWLLLVAGIGFFTSRRHDQSLFKHGFRYAFMMGIMITMTHLKFMEDYLLSHPEERLLMETIFEDTSKIIALLLIAPVYWVILGILSGLTSLLWERLR